MHVLCVLLPPPARSIKTLSMRNTKPGQGSKGYSVWGAKSPGGEGTERRRWRREEGGEERREEWTAERKGMLLAVLSRLSVFYPLARARKTRRRRQDAKILFHFLASSCLFSSSSPSSRAREEESRHAKGENRM